MTPLFPSPQEGTAHLVGQELRITQEGEGSGNITWTRASESLRMSLLEQQAHTVRVIASLKYLFAQSLNWASVFLFKFAGPHGFTFQYPWPVKNLSPSPFLHGANINPHQSPQECCTCESKFNQEKKGLGFYYVNFIGTFPSCPYIQQSVWIQLQLHSLPHICSLIVIVTFSQGI